MQNLDQCNISSFDAIINSITFDSEVCRWFTFLVTQPGLAAELQAEKGIPPLYQKLKSVFRKQRILLIALTAAASASLFFPPRWAVLSLLSVLSFYWAYLEQVKKKCVTAISASLIRRDYSADTLLQTTLYQLGEHYSRKYRIPSLVDKIFRANQILKFAVIFFLLFILATGIETTEWKIVAIVFLYYYAVVYGLRTDTVYRRLR